MKGCKPHSRRKLLVGSANWCYAFKRYGFVLASAETFECPICWETTSTSFQLTCSCGNRICESCSYRWIQNNYSAPQCSECNVAWTEGFLREQLHPNWVRGTRPGELRYLIKKRLCDAERAKIPETMDVLRAILARARYGKSTAQRHRFWKVYKRVTRTADTTREPSQYYQYVCQCPNDTCNGLVDRQWACAVCQCRVCKKCHEVRTASHACDPATVATVQSAQQNTKPCPVCAVPIYRISGCDQMWCTQCHTSFSWRDGSRITSTIHNPHAVAWLNQQQEGERRVVLREAEACGALPDVSLVLPSSTYGRRRDSSGLVAPYRAVSAVMEWLPYLREAMTRTDDRFQRYRIRYILGDFTDDAYGRRLYQLARRVKQVRTYHDIFDTLRIIGLRVFHRLARHDATTLESVQTLHKARTFINTTIQKELPQLGKRDAIRDDWDIHYDRRIQQLLV